MEDIIHAQKAVAKVSIGRSKENADALMNSNDHIMEKISMLEAVLSDNVSHPAPETNKNDSAYAQNILDNQNKILQQLEVLQNTLNTIGADAKIAAESAKQNFFTEERILAEENKIEKEEPQVQEAAVEEIPSAAGEATVIGRDTNRRSPSDYGGNTDRRRTVRDGGDTDRRRTVRDGGDTDRRRTIRDGGDTDRRSSI